MFKSSLLSLKNEGRDRERAYSRMRIGIFLALCLMATAGNAQETSEKFFRGLICEAREGDQFHYCQVPGAGQPPRQAGGPCSCTVGFGQGERTVPGRIVWKQIPNEAIPKGSSAYHDCMDAGGYHGDCAHHLK